MNLNSNLSQDIYTSYLEKVSGVRFTHREIDIIACLLSGKSVKTIAFCLSISPKTIEVHMRNIMSKLECNSRDGVIDFIEKSKKLPLFKTYYSHLLVQNFFEKKLVKLSTIKGPTYSECVIVYWNSQKSYISLINTLTDHLKMVGIKTTIKANEDLGSLFTERTLNLNKSNLIIYVVPYAQDKQGKNAALSKTEINTFIKKILKSNTFVILLPTWDDLSNEESTSVKNACILTDGNYYEIVFEIIKKLFPHLALEEAIQEFKTYSASIYGDYNIISRPTSEQKISDNGQNLYLKNILTNFSFKKSWLVPGSLFGLFMMLFLSVG